MSLKNKIQQNQMLEGEQAVIDNLKSMGLLEDDKPDLLWTLISPEIIEILEQALKEWKADLANTNDRSIPPASFCNGGVQALQSAIGKIKELSNTQMQIDTKAKCEYYHGRLKSEGDRFCRGCGKPLHD